jgi:mannitol-1-phosphate 5-dehydrogenase
MAFDGTRRLVGLGFGAIQAGLFVYEAQLSGDYAAPLLVEVRSDLVAALRAAGGRFSVNIARMDGIDTAQLGPVEVADSGAASDRARVIEAIASADELTTALPSVASYRSDAPNSPHRLIAAGLLRRHRPEPLLVICAENHRNAAALLTAAVADALPPAGRDEVLGRGRWIDSVIGKMSGVIDDPDELRALALATITPGQPAAFLVEEFDRILVSRADPDGGPAAQHPGMLVLREVGELGPFEDAKLLGHNAIHALAGCLGMLLGLERMSELTAVPGCLAFLRAAFLEESGAALIARHGGADELFTPAGYTAFADDLLARMTNPWLADTVERAARDPRRKLGWDDRLIGLIRLGHDEGVPTPRMAVGAAAALEIVEPGEEPTTQLDRLRELWPDDVDPEEAAVVRSIVAGGIAALWAWRTEGFAPVSGSTQP